MNQQALQLQLLTFTHLRRLLAIKQDYLNALDKRLDEQLDIARQLYLFRQSQAPQ